MRRDMEDLQQCSMCPKDATWIRSTQFSGQHPYCEECAKKEKDFMKEDASYFYWFNIADLKKDE